MESNSPTTKIWNGWIVVAVSTFRFERGTTSDDTSADSSNWVGYNDGDERGTSGEDIITDSSNWVGYIDGDERATVAKDTSTDSSNYH